MIFAGTHDGVVHVWNSEGKLLTKLLRPTNETALVAMAPAAVRNGRPGKDARISDRKKPLTGKPGRASQHLRPTQTNRVVALTAEPGQIQLSADTPHHGVLITAHRADGFEEDVTGSVKFSTERRAPFTVNQSGDIYARQPGEGKLIASFGGQRIEILVRIESSSRGETNSSSAFDAPPVSFVRDLLPALSKAGCNAGSCHAKAEGQNGFKLSVFSYDPKSDYAHIVKDARGRRYFRLLRRKASLSRSQPLPSRTKAVSALNLVRKPISSSSAGCGKEWLTL